MSIRRKIRSYLFNFIHWECWHKWRTWLTIFVVFFYFLMILIFLPLLIVALYKSNAKAHFSAWIVAAIFVLLTIPIFLANLLQHLFNYTRPHLQAHIIRIIWIVPIYSVDSWLGLTFPSTGIYWTTLRECYESYALYNFLVYLLHYLESENPLVEILEWKPPTRHLFPFCCCYPWPAGRRFIHWVKVGVLQYALIRPILTVIALITQLCGVYEQGQFRADRSFLYIAVANSVSQGIAIYSLLYFYKAVHDLLKPINPVYKFATIKAIIFFTFWQAVLVALLVALKIIPETVPWDSYGLKEDVATSLQNFIICVEMLGFAVAFYYVFSHKPYVDGAVAQVPCFASCIKMLDLRDIYGDVKEHFVDPLPLPIPGIVLRQHKKKQSPDSIALPLRKKKEVMSDEDNEDCEELLSEDTKEDHPLLNGIDSSVTCKETGISVDIAVYREGAEMRERHVMAGYDENRDTLSPIVENKV